LKLAIACEEANPSKNNQAEISKILFFMKEWGLIVVKYWSVL
jgi:hypothetical protein